MSHTSPRDVVRSSAVSKLFFSVSESNTVWDKFLPDDYHDVISQSCSPIPTFALKKHLFLHLCHTHIFLHKNTQSFGLDKWRGKKCYTLGARALQIAWGTGDTPWYWRFESVPESESSSTGVGCELVSRVFSYDNLRVTLSSGGARIYESELVRDITKVRKRFPEVAELKSEFWLEIKGRIHVKQLSPHTTYGAYIVFKMLPNNHFGFETTPVKITMLEVDEEDEGPPRNNNHAMNIKSFYLQSTSRKAHLRRVKRSPGDVPVDRGDGWMEVDMGRYHVGDIHRVSPRTVVEITLWEVEAGHMKSGLVVQSIDLRPMD